MRSKSQNHSLPNNDFTPNDSKADRLRLQTYPHLFISYQRNKNLHFRKINLDNQTHPDFQRRHNARESNIYVMGR